MVLRVLSGVLIILFFGLNANAQHTIMGKIADGNGVAIPSASLILQGAADSIIAAVTITDSLGAYRIETGLPSFSGLLVRAEGYGQKRITIQDTNRRFISLDIQLDKIPSQLKGVTVSGQKPLIERKADRTIFNVEGSIASIGGDALEVLKKAPGVVVTNDNIAIAGKSTVEVMLNGRLLQLSGDELSVMLKSIPAENLSRIEIITTPPAKYDAAGNAGLINIITKKQTKNGLNGNATLSYGQHISGGGGLNGSFNYRHNKLNIFGIGNVFHIRQRPGESISTFYPAQRLEQVKDIDNVNIFNRLQVGADYNLTDHAVLGILYTIGNGGLQYYASEDIVTRAINARTNVLDSIIRTRAEQSDRGFRNVLNLNYELKMDSSGKKLNIDLDYFSRIGKSARSFITQPFLADGSPTGFNSDDRNSGKQVIDIRAVKVDLEWPSGSAKFSFGGKASFVHNTSDNLFEFLTGGSYQADPSKTNAFEYNENTQALYGSAERTLGKWELQAGLRAEYTQTKGHSPTTNETNTSDYFKLFPTVYAQYSPNGGNAVNISYSRRIERPSFWIMNPFRAYSTPASYEEGNPFLQPSFSHNIELGYTLKSVFNFSIYTELERSLFTRVSIIDTVNNTFHFSQANAGSENNYGASASGTLKPAKWWECNVLLRGYYADFKSGYYGADRQLNYARPSLYAQMGNTITLNKAKTFLASLDYMYLTDEQSAFDIQYTHSAVTIGFRILLLDKKLTIALNAYDPLRTEKFQVRNLYNGTLQDSYYDERNLRLALTWKFGNKGIRGKREREAGAEESRRAQ